MKKALLLITSLLCFLTGCNNSKSELSLQSQVDDLYSQIEELNAQLKQVQKEKDDVIDENSKLNDQLSKIKSERDSLKAEIETAKKEVTVEEGDVTVKVVDKVNIPQNVDNWQFYSYSMFYINITNNTDKPVKGIQGYLDVKDMFGVSICKFSCDLTGFELSKGQSTTIKDKGLRINEYKNNDVKIYNAKFEDLMFEFEVNAIVFSDGTSKTK